MKGAQFLVPALIQTLLLPPLFAYTILVLARLPSLPPLVRFLVYVSSFGLVYLLRSQLSAWSTARQARALGARDIPRVKGRWPLNLDVMRDWIRSGSEEEVGRMMVLFAREYGDTYNTRVLGEDQIISTDPAVLKHVLIDDFDNFVKGPKFKDRAEAFLGDGIFNSDGERWKFHRSLMRPFFHPTHISPSVFTPHIRRFLSSLPTTEPFDMQVRVGQLALEMAVLWMCGEDISPSAASGSASAVDEEEGAEWSEAKVALGKAMTEAQRVVGRRVKIGTVWPLFELGHDPLAEPMRIIRTFFRPIIARAMRRREERADMDRRTITTSGDRAGRAVEMRFIDMLVDATTDRKLVEDQLINVLLASRDTLSACLTFCVYCLVLHPDITGKLQGEVARVVGEDGEITKDAIRELRYNRAFINEVLRLFPPVPLNIRRTVRPSLLPASTTNGDRRPMYMPANTSIILATVLMQRDPAVWGEDAQAFRPERWIDPLGQKEREGFMSWNIGPRMCLGQPFALTVTHTFLILLSRHLDKLKVANGNSQLQFAPAAQPEGTGVPEAWTTEEGSDGRARGGRERAWVVADVVLAIKGGLWLCFAHDHDHDR